MKSRLRQSLVMLLLVPVLVAIAFSTAAVTAVADDIALTPVGRFNFSFPDGYPSAPFLNTDLSGLTWIKPLSDGGQVYYAVSDKQNNSLVPLAIDIDLSNGAINSVDVDLPVFLKDENGSAIPFLDTEGVAYDITTDSLFVSCERGTEVGFTGVGIRQFDADSLELENDIIAGSSSSQFDVFTNIRGGFGLESCGARGNGKAIWTTSQVGLSIDPILTVRLQKLDDDLTPIGQYPYDITADPGAADGFASVAENNVHDLMALPNGTLISLELVIGRDASDVNRNRLSIYELDFAGASNVAGGSVTGATRVTKRLLYQEFFNAIADSTVTEEFEGIALGPELDNGDFSVILIADSGSKPKHALYAFSLTTGSQESSGD